MSALLDEVQRQAQRLTPQEKAALAHFLIEELDSSNDADVEQLWIEESGGGMRLISKVTYSRDREMK